MIEVTHEVRHHHQPDRNSCWWACAAMLMRFHGHRFHRYPWQHDDIFARIRSEDIPRGARVADVAVRDPEQWFERHPVDPAVVREDRDRLRRRRTWPEGFVHPTYWYRLGLPHETRHVELLLDLTPLRWIEAEAGPVVRLDEAARMTAWRSRLGPWIELLTNQPVLHTRTRGGARHARLITGLRHEDGDPDTATVRIQDPAAEDGVPPERDEDTWQLLRHVVGNTGYCLRCVPA